MKAIVKMPFFDEKGLHKIGDEVTVKEISYLVEPKPEAPKKGKKEK